MFRWLLVAGRHRLTDSQWVRDGQSGSQWPGIQWWLRRHLPLPGNKELFCLDSPFQIEEENICPRVVICSPWWWLNVLYHCNQQFYSHVSGYASEELWCLDPGADEVTDVKPIKVLFNVERVCFVSLSVVLAVWRVGGRGDWRPSASQRQWADVCPLCRRTRILECSFGEGICQVRAVSWWMCVVFTHTFWSTWSICTLFQHVRCRTVKRVHVRLLLWAFSLCLLLSESMAATKLCLVAPPPKVSKTSPEALLRTTTCAGLRPTYSRLWRRPWRLELYWAALSTWGFFSG